MEARTPTGSSSDDRHTWRVVDDLARDHPATPAELDAVEAFLMPLVHALLADTSDTQPGENKPGHRANADNDSQAPQ